MASTRPQEGVDIEASTGTGNAGNGYDVGWFEPGDWMKYSVNVASAAGYAVTFRVASGVASGTAGSFHVEDETGKHLTGSITVSSRGDGRTGPTLPGQQP